MSNTGEKGLVPETDPEQVSETDKRVRTLTEKGVEMYESGCDAHQDRLHESSKQIEALVSNLPECADNRMSLARLENDLVSEYNHYRALSAEYRAFLNRTGTLRSTEDLSTHSESESKYVQMAETALMKYNETANAGFCISQFKVI